MSARAAEIEDWLVARISDLSGVAAHEIDRTAPVSRYGLDSIATVALATELEKWLGYRFQENPLNDHPTIVALAQFLAEQPEKA